MPSILVVDDQLAMRNMFRHILEAEEHDCTMAVDGDDGWVKAQTKDFDIILTDYHMPKMNGIELCKKLRASNRHKFTPILIVSTESSTEKKSEGRAARASGWIVKPITGEALIPALNRLIK